MSRRWIAALVLGAVSASWGTIPLIVRNVDLPAEQLVAARLWLGAIPLLAWITARRLHHLPREEIPRVVALGLILAGHWAAFFWSLKTTTVAIALVLVYLAPVLLAAFAPRMLGEQTGARTWVAVAMALVGVMLVARPSEGATISGTVSGLIAAASLAALILVGKPVAQRLGGLRLAAYEHSVAALVMTPWAIAALGPCAVGGIRQPLGSNRLVAASDPGCVHDRHYRGSLLDDRLPTRSNRGGGDHVLRACLSRHLGRALPPGNPRTAGCLGSSARGHRGHCRGC